jgi:type VI secretion system Hcp family effector
MAVDFFLDIKVVKSGKIKGESTTDGFADQIQVNKFTIAAKSPEERNMTGAWVATGKPFAEIAEFEIPTCVASPPLFKTLCENGNIATAVLSCRKTGANTGKDKTYLQWTFKDARVVSYKQVGHDSAILDVIGLTYAYVEIQYRQQKANGELAPALTASMDWGSNTSTSQ